MSGTVTASTTDTESLVNNFLLEHFEIKFLLIKENIFQSVLKISAQPLLNPKDHETRWVRGWPEVGGRKIVRNHLKCSSKSINEEAKRKKVKQQQMR